LYRQKNRQGVVNMKQRSKLKVYEYQEIFKKYYDEGWSHRQIATYLGRSPSTVNRVLNDNRHGRPGNWKLLSSYSKGMYAWEKFKKRMSQSRKRLRLKSERIRKVVTFILRKWHWSPETISDFLERHGVLISAKAIYRFIKKERESLTEYLRQRGKVRRQRVARKRSIFRTGVPEKKSIHEREPLILDDKMQCGHWELDTIHSKKGTPGGILTLRERASKKCFFFLIPDLSAATTNKILIPFFQDLPIWMRKTLTADNGPENAELYKLEKICPDFKVYYCDPYKAYQRGSVENGNGEARWYFPKKTDLSQVPAEALRKAEYKINSKPRKTNGGISSTALFNILLKAAA